MQSPNLDFLRVASGTGTGPVFHNERFDLAVVQIVGTFTALSMSLEGRTNTEGPWETIAGWNAATPETKGETVSAKGIYKFPIEGIVELRFRILSISGGYVDAVGVLYDSLENTVFPHFSETGPITFGNPSLFVKGQAEQIFFDPATGNIVGYDRTATDGSVSITANLSEITGGMGNQLIGVLPDTARISGTYTSAAFSLETRERIMGGKIAYDAVAQTCEIVTAESEVLRVSGRPARSLAESPEDTQYWCYVRPEGSQTLNGANVSVDPVSKEVRDYAAEVGKNYEVTYFTHRISAQMLPMPTIWNPVIMTVQVRFGVYGKQNRTEEQGILRGWLYFVVPRAILNADAGVNGSQTGTATTEGGWIALPEKPENIPMCDCGGSIHPLAYYVYVPCAGQNDAVVDVVAVGNGLTLRARQTKPLPLKLVMPNDSLVQPDFTTMNYYSENDAVATVNGYGAVTGVSEGDTVIHAFATKSDGTVLDSVCRVSVTGGSASLTSTRSHIFVE